MVAFISMEENTRDILTMINCFVFGVPICVIFVAFTKFLIWILPLLIVGFLFNLWIWRGFNVTR